MGSHTSEQIIIFIHFQHAVIVDVAGHDGEEEGVDREVGPLACCRPRAIAQALEETSDAILAQTDKRGFKVEAGMGWLNQIEDPPS